MNPAANKLCNYDWLSLVPAGGLGSRLGQLTRAQAKPSLPVAFDGNGEIIRMIDIPLRAIRAAGGGALVSLCYAAESLDFIHQYDHVDTVKSQISDSPIDTLLSCLPLLEASNAEHIGLIPADTDITPATIQEMRILLDVTGADAVLLATRQFEGHNIRSVDQAGMLCADSRAYDRIGDMGIHMFKRSWLLERLYACLAADPLCPREVWNDIYRVSNPAGRIYLYVPEHDLLDVDMGTPELFRKTILKYNYHHRDKNGNVIFPGACLDPASKYSVALPGSYATIPLTHAVVPEGGVVLSPDDYFLCAQ
ncbi:MAG TPA: hypothetical protein VIQ80_01090 [Candidatus Saccharimonadales bacterium]